MRNTPSFLKIILVGEFCTSHRSLSSSHTLSMLWTQRLVLHKIPSTTSDFEVVESFAPHKNNLIIDDFEVVGGILLRTKIAAHYEF